MSDFWTSSPRCQLLGRLFRVIEHTEDETLAALVDEMETLLGMRAPEPTAPQPGRPSLRLVCGSPEPHEQHEQHATAPRPDRRHARPGSRARRRRQAAE